MFHHLVGTLSDLLIEGLLVRVQLEELKPRSHGLGFLHLGAAPMPGECHRGVAERSGDNMDVPRRWKKSSFSGQETDCVELVPELDVNGARILTPSRRMKMDPLGGG
jgi:Domain of unknown function (DUF397)